MVPPGWRCTRRVGFLFPHACDKVTPMGCPDCQNGQLTDPYRQRVDRYTYTDYDDYNDSIFSVYGMSSGIANFTEADGEALVKPEEEFEDDMTAS